jgi:hypothetical protein
VDRKHPLGIKRNPHFARTRTRAQDVDILPSPTGDVDFVAVNTSLTVPENSGSGTRRCFQFMIIGDDQREPNETFSITFFPANNLDGFEGGSVVIVLIIDDNDSKFV